MTEHSIRVAASDLIAPWIAVTIDGEPIKMVIEADEESGTGTRYATDTSGNLIVEGDHVKTEQFTGKVRLSLISGAPEAAVIEYQRLREAVAHAPEKHVE